MILLRSLHRAQTTMATKKLHTTLPVFADWLYAGVLLQHQLGLLQLCLSLHFLIMWSLTFSQRDAGGLLRSFLSMCQPGHTCGLLVSGFCESLSKSLFLLPLSLFLFRLFSLSDACLVYYLLPQLAVASRSVFKHFWQLLARRPLHPWESSESGKKKSRPWTDPSGSH